MAAIDTSRTVYGSASVANRFTSALTALISTLVVWNDARMTRKSLSALSDRELEDIGLCRGDIDTVSEGRR